MKISRYLLLFLLALTSCVQQATPIPTAVFPPNKLGFHLLLDDGRNQWPTTLWPSHLQTAQNGLGKGGYVVQLIRSDDLSAEKWEGFIATCAQLQLRPILRLATTFDHDNNYWHAPQADAHGRYHALARRYANFIAQLPWHTPPIIIVGNEPNHGNEWGGTPNPAAYARFLIDVSHAIKAQIPQAIILNAGLDAFTPHTAGQPFVDGMAYIDAETFLDEMVAAEPSVFAAIDGWASHPYPLGPFAAPPWQQTYGRDMLNGATNPHHQPPPAGIHNRGINGYEWELWKLAQYGVTSLDVYITETGWRHAETQAPNALDGQGTWPTAETTAIYTELALWGNHRHPSLPTNGWTPWLEDERVTAVAFFALNGNPTEWGHTNLLTLTPTGEITGFYPAYERLQQHAQ